MAVRTERFRAPKVRVRTYHEPRDTVTDHASGERRSYRAVIDGDAFAELVEARRRALAEKDTQNEQ